jgi:hypothetical protein
VSRKRWPTPGLNCSSQLYKVGDVTAVMVDPEFQQSLQVNDPNALHLRFTLQIRR